MRVYDPDTRGVIDSDDFLPLVTENGYHRFVLKITRDIPGWFNFIVFSVNSWDEHNIPFDIEHCLSGTIRPDGCSHINFGYLDENERPSSYLHLCGKSEWINHIKMMMSVYDLARKSMDNFTDDESGIEWMVNWL